MQPRTDLASARIRTLTPPRIYLNGFPKAGLHAAERMVIGLLMPVDVDYNWYGTNAWETERHNLDKAGINMACIMPGHYLKGHTGYLPSLEALMRGMGIGMVLVVRDLRDVVVSHAYHIMSSKHDILFHAGRDLYPDDKHECMKAIIEGVEGYEGIFERWATYAPWIDQDWLHIVRFEELIKKPEMACNQFFDYAYGLALAEAGMDESGLDKRIRQAAIDGMLYEMKMGKSYSPTYRKGKCGTWKREFTPEIVALFKKYDTDNALMKLGYVNRKDW